jgi:hypothetical protein
MNYLIPHTTEWFDALESCNPQQAAMTRQIVDLAGRTDVCPVCGDFPALDYKVVGASFTPQIGATIRLCDDCREIRRSTEVESYIKF